MPRSSGQKPESGNDIQLEPVLPKENPSTVDSRPQLTGAQPKSTVTCSLFYFIRRKKTSPSSSPESGPRNHRLLSGLNCSSGRSRRRSDRTLPLPREERHASEQPNKQPPTPASSTAALSTAAPSVSSPEAPLLKVHTSGPSQHVSRSRSKHRRERGRKHRGDRTTRAQSEHSLRHEDLPPHPSLYRKTIVKISSAPPTVKSFRSKSRLVSSDGNKSQTSRTTKQSDTDSASRHRAHSESSVNVRSRAESSASAAHQESKEGSTANHPQKDKSVHSASRTDLEEESRLQVTVSSSDQLSRRSYRSQSLPSFRSDHFLFNADTKVISDAEDFEYNPSDMQAPLQMSLCGCGFLGMYHLGVLACLTQRAPALLDRVEKVGGASAGALMAAVLVTARDKIEESADHVQNLAMEMRKKPLGALTPGYSFTRSLRYMLDQVLPQDAHQTAQDKLFVSLTNADTRKNEVMSDFQSRDELIEALVASCYIPVYAGIKMPMIRGKKYIDGGLSDNLPRFPTGKTITVSPFDGKSDIGPKQGQEMEKKAHFICVHNQDIQVTMKNIKRGAHAFFPPKREKLQEYFERGRYDASRFLIREGLYEIVHQPQSKRVLYESSV